MKLPKAKTDNIVVQELKDELLVYNLTTHQAFTLNETLKVVYQSCDGQTSFADLKRRYKFTDDLIYFALAELSANGLLEDYRANHFAGLSRREIIRRVGLAALVALPVISMIVAPPAAAAASQVPAPCTSTCVAAGSNICPTVIGGSVSTIIILREYSSTNGTCTGTYTDINFPNGNRTCFAGTTFTSTKDVCKFP